MINPSKKKNMDTVYQQSWFLYVLVSMMFHSVFFSFFSDHPKNSQESHAELQVSCVYTETKRTSNKDIQKQQNNLGLLSQPLDVSSLEVLSLKQHPTSKGMEVTADTWISMEVIGSRSRSLAGWLISPTYWTYLKKKAALKKKCMNHQPQV